MKATGNRGHGAPPDDRLTCATAETLAVRSAIHELDVTEETLLTAHLANCQRCRVVAIENGEFVASVRSLDSAMGLPSRRFAERLRARLAIERALSTGQAASENKVSADAKDLAHESERRSAPARSGERARQGLTGGATRPRAQTVIVSSSRWFRSRPTALWLAAGLIVSITLNFLWVTQNLFSAETSPIALAAGLSNEAAIPHRAGVEASLEKLRGLQDLDGLIDGDVTATAWWLIAESRAMGPNGMGPSRTEESAGFTSIEPLTPERIHRAQSGLLGSTYQSSRAKAVAALALAESTSTFGAGNKVALARFVGTQSLTDLEGIARDQIRLLVNTPKPNSGSESFLDDSARRAAVQNVSGVKGRTGARNADLTLAGLANGNAHGLLAFVYPEIAGAASEGTVTHLTDFRPGSARAEALFAAALVSAQE